MSNIDDGFTVEHPLILALQVAALSEPRGRRPLTTHIVLQCLDCWQMKSSGSEASNMSDVAALCAVQCLATNMQPHLR